MSLKIVYLDDEVDLLETFYESFIEDGVEIVCYSEPAKAIEQLKQNAPDVLFIDFRMPGMTGEEVVKKLAVNYPVYLITGDLHIKTDFPFVKILKKPYDFEEITAIVQSHKQQKNAA